MWLLLPIKLRSKPAFRQRDGVAAQFPLLRGGVPNVNMAAHVGAQAHNAVVTINDRRVCRAALKRDRAAKHQQELEEVFHR